MDGLQPVPLTTHPRTHKQSERGIVVLEIRRVMGLQQRPD